MTDYEFTLKFQLPDATEDPEQYVERLIATSCDDALAGIGRRGRIALDFNRTAKSAFEAIISAVQDVRKAIPDAVLIEATPDLVGLSDLAEITDRSRQYMRKLVVNNAETFPSAVHEGNLALWHLASVLTWLYEHQKQLPVDAVLLEVAKTNMKLNIAKEARQLPGAILPKDLAPLFA